MAGRSIVKLETEVKGPFFERHQEIARVAEEAVAGAAQDTYSEVKTYLARVLKHPSGAYQAAVHKDVRGSFAQVGDGGATYGPWLESGRTLGPGGRPRRTRFKGYAAFRRTRRRVAKLLREAAKRAAELKVQALS